MEKNNTHLAGEFFVAAELFKRDIQVALMLGNSKDVDLIIRKANNEKCSVQVKALKSKNCFDLQIDKVIQDFFYVFVFINGKNESPDYFILTGKELIDGKESFYGASLGREDKRETINYGPLQAHKGRWDKIESVL